MFFDLLLAIIPIRFFSNCVHYLPICAQISRIKRFGLFFGISIASVKDMLQPQWKSVQWRETIFDFQ